VHNCHFPFWTLFGSLFETKTSARIVDWGQKGGVVLGPKSGPKVIFWAFLVRLTEYRLKWKKGLKTEFAKGVILDLFLDPFLGHFWRVPFGTLFGTFGRGGLLAHRFGFGPAKQVLKMGCVLGPKKGPKKGPKTVTGEKRTFGGVRSSSVHIDNLWRSRSAAQAQIPGVMTSSDVKTPLVGFGNGGLKSGFGQKYQKWQKEEKQEKRKNTEITTQELKT
jgi:hypothetical protein